jgi:hypothetical protein
MKKQSLNFLAILLLGITVSCHKDTEVLPEATQAGKGTFSCMYDDKVLIIPGAYATYTQDDLTGDFYISIVANHSTTATPQNIYIGFINVFTKGIFPITEGRADIGVSLPNSDYAYRSYSGSVQLTKFDTVNKIVSGTFNTDLVLTSILQQGFLIPKKRPEDKDSISIRSGRFDLPLTKAKY